MRNTEKEKNRKRKMIIRYAIMTLFVVETLYMIITLPILISGNIGNKNKAKKKSEENVIQQNKTQENTISVSGPVSNTVDDWRLMIASNGHAIPDDYSIELATIEGDLKFDHRAIEELNDLRNSASKAGYKNLWVQSAYRSVKLQKTLFENKVKEYKNKGKKQAEAEELANKLVNRPGESDHNLGLAVDFNYVNESFDELPVYTWLCNHADEYGFILRYPKDKEDITKVSYEPWHWRYVGKEHAKKIKEKGYCLEEYVQSLKQ